MSLGTNPQDRIEQLERKIAELEFPSTSGIQERLNDGEAEVIDLAETLIGMALSREQAFYIGKLLGKFGTNQVKRALQQKRHARDPLRAAYSALMNGAFGKVKKDIPSNGFENEGASYWKAPQNFDPWEN